MSHTARDGDLLPICFQMLLYPSVEMSMQHPSYRLDFSRLPLSLETVRYFHGHYLRDERDQADWRASPLRAATFRGLAPAFILTAGYDPLRDEGMEYARMLEENDVPTTFVHMSDQMHGFLACRGHEATWGWVAVIHEYKDLLRSGFYRADAGGGTVLSNQFRRQRDQEAPFRRCRRRCFSLDQNSRGSLSLSL